MTAVTERPRRANASGGPTPETVSGFADRGTGPPTTILPEQLTTWTRGRRLMTGARPIVGGAVDSRLVRPGEIFFALPGERTDGHLFLEAATAAGAGALVVTDELPATRLDSIASSALDGGPP